MSLKQKARRVAALGLCATGLAMSGAAQAEDLIQLYQAALNNDPKLKAAEFDHQATQERVTQAWAGYRPTVNLSYDTNDTTQNIVSSDNTVYQAGTTTFPSTNWTLSLSQPIFRYSNYIRIGQAKTEVRQADAQLENARQDMALRVSEAYLQTLAAKDDLMFIQAELAAARKQLERAVGRENAAVGRAADRFDAEARVASVEADYAGGEVALLDAREALYEMTGAEPEALLSLRDDFQLTLPEPQEEEHWITTATKNNPALVAQREAVDVARQEIKRQNGGHFPTLDLVWQTSNRVTEGTLFGGGSEVETQEMMLRLNVPIYAGGAVSSQKREASARYYSEEQNLTRIMRESRRQSREAYRGVTNAIKRVNALKKEVVAQQAKLDLRQAAYESGLETVVSVLDAEQDLYSASRDLSRAKYDYLIYGLRLKALVGALTQDDLLAVNGLLEQ